MHCFLKYGVLPFILLSLMGCKNVYYNTFYNATKRFNEAEHKRLEAQIPGSRVNASAYEGLYMLAIRKASAVLDLHPNSKYVDDSLLLIGKAFYWREEYSEALTKFQEIQENFPNSSLTEETIYWQGLSLWASDQINPARFALNAIEDDSDFYQQAQLSLADLEVVEENFEGAIDAYQSVLERFGKQRKVRAQAWQGIGNSLLRLERYGEALDAYGKVLDSKPDVQVDFETRIQMGATLERQGNLHDASAVYSEILKSKRLLIYKTETLLRQANVYRQSGEVLAAIEAYEGVAEENPRTEYSARAYYQIALIEQRNRKNLARADSLFGLATRESRSSDAGKEALQRQKDLKSLIRYQRQIEESKGGVKRLEILFNLAELYLFNMSEPDSALLTYQRALEFADTSALAPKALYAIGLIYADSLKEERVARETFQKLIDTYPMTPYAVEAAERIRLDRTDDAFAEARFLEAEALQQEGVNAEDYMGILEQVAEEYPQSLFAPKALFTLAWIFENDFDELEKARDHYQKVVDTYPMTTFAARAGDKLQGGYLDTTSAESKDGVASPGKPPADAAELSKDATPLEDLETPMEFDAVDEKPLLRGRVTASYPDELLEEGLEGTVVIRALVGKFGQVEDTEIKSGPFPLADAAIEAAKMYRFRPGKHDGKYRSVWMELSIPFKAGAMPFDLIDQKPKIAYRPPPDSYESAVRDALEELEAPVERSRLEELLGGVVTIELSVLVGKDGVVEEIKRISGDVRLYGAAENVMYEYEFEPGMHRGNPRAVWMEISVRFVLPN